MITLLGVLGAVGALSGGGARALPPASSPTASSALAGAPVASRTHEKPRYFKPEPPAAPPWPVTRPTARTPRPPGSRPIDPLGSVTITGYDPIYGEQDARAPPVPLTAAQGARVQVLT
jgi:hypothetical protein